MYNEDEGQLCPSFTTKSTKLTDRKSVNINSRRTTHSSVGYYDHAFRDIVFTGY